MELPEDVVQLVRAYAKPRFRYFREYKCTLRLLRMDSFPDLKKILQENPEQILPTLERLENAHFTFDHLSNEYRQRYMEYLYSKELRMKRADLSGALDELYFSRSEIFRIVKLELLLESPV